MSDAKFERCEDPNDPARCQGAIVGGQCPFKGRLTTSGQRAKYCERHIHQAHAEVSHSPPRVDPLRNYRFSIQFQPRIDELSSNEKIKNLREEIALCRMVLETIVNRCQDAYDLTMETERISKLVDQVNKLVVSCHKIEESTGQLIDKTVIINIGGMMVNILEKYVEDKSKLDVIGREIYEAIEKSSRREITDGVES